MNKETGKLSFSVQEQVLRTSSIQMYLNEQEFYEIKIKSTLFLNK